MPFGRFRGDLISLTEEQIPCSIAYDRRPTWPRHFYGAYVMSSSDSGRGSHDEPEKRGACAHLQTVTIYCHIDGHGRTGQP